MDSEQNLTEEQIRAVVRDELESQTETIAESIPFTRREIIKGAMILGVGAAGASLGTYGAVGRAAAQTSSGSGTIGTSDNPLEAIYVDDLYQTTDNLSVGELDVNTRQLYIQPTEPSSPSQGDIWIDTSEVE